MYLMNYTSLTHTYTLTNTWLPLNTRTHTCGEVWACERQGPGNEAQQRRVPRGAPSVLMAQPGLSITRQWAWPSAAREKRLTSDSSCNAGTLQVPVCYPSSAYLSELLIPFLCSQSVNLLLGVTFSVFAVCGFVLLSSSTCISDRGEEHRSCFFLLSLTPSCGR